MAKLTFETPEGDKCYGCLGLDGRSFYCKVYEVFLKNEYGNAGCSKCDECKKLDK